MMTFERVEQIFEEVYGELREANGENAPNSYTWLARSPAELTEQGAAGYDPISAWVGKYAGSPLADTVAYVWECNGFTMAHVQTDATDDDVRDLFRLYVGLTEEL